MDRLFNDEQGLAVFHRLAVFHQDGLDRARLVRFDLIEHLHRLDNTQGVADVDSLSYLHERFIARRGGTVAFDVPHGHEVAQFLLSRNIIVDYRVGAGIRIGPHFYTRDEELDACIGAIDECLSTGQWERFAAAARSAVVT